MRVCFYVLLFSFRQLSQQLQLTAVIKADAADGDLPFYSLQITAQQADSFRFELVKAEQFFQTAFPSHRKKSRLPHKFQQQLRIKPFFNCHLNKT